MASDVTLARPDEGAVVTIVERGSGEVHIVKAVSPGIAISTTLAVNPRSLGLS